MFLNKKSLITLIFIFFFCASSGFAQGTTGQLIGTVTDPNGAVVSGATIKIINLDTSSEREATTGDEGDFAFQLLPPGRYRVETTTNGFQIANVEAVVNITQTTKLDISL